jgi:hypothetical protein
VLHQQLHHLPALVLQQRRLARQLHGARQVLVAVDNEEV